LDNKKRATRGSPRTMEKRKNRYEIGEGLEQRRKSREDIRSQKFMQGNARQLGVITLKVVTCRIPSKPQKENNSI
jgi:hypothetical protein